MQVYIFMCNDKGSTWAYSTPGYGAALVPAHLRLMREAACAQGEDARTRSTTEVRPDPPTIRTRSTEVRSVPQPAARGLFTSHSPQCSINVLLIEA